MPFWHKADESRAMAEGWWLCSEQLRDTPHVRFAIQRLDNPREANQNYDEPKFATDNEALQFVIRRAAGGSRLHLLALFITGRPVMMLDREEFPDWLTDPASGDEIESVVLPCEQPGFILEHKGVCVYYTEKDACMSSYTVAVEPMVWFMECDRTFDWRYLDGFGDTPELVERYKALYPDDEVAQVLAYNIDLGHITTNGYKQVTSYDEPPTPTQILENAGPPRDITKLTGDREPALPASLLLNSEGTSPYFQCKETGRSRSDAPTMTDAAKDGKQNDPDPGK